MTTLTTTGRKTLPGVPTPVAPGIRCWRNTHNRWVGVLLHYSADPEGATKDVRHLGSDTNVASREHELNFSAFAGKPVYASFDEAKHVSEKVHYVPEFEVLRSFDFGYHHPAVSYYQWFGGSLWCLGELMGEDITLDRFIREFVRPYEAAVFGEAPVSYKDFGDPAGKQVNDKSDFSSFGILANHGIHPMYKKSEINEGLILVRRQLELPGGYLIHPRCRLLIQGMKGGYRYAEPTKANPAPQFPLKDGYFDHLQDTQRYMAVHTIPLRDVRPKPPGPETKPPFWDEAFRDRLHTPAGEYGDWE